MERILHKIGKIREYIALVNSIKGDCIARFSSDPLYRGALLHYLYLLADSCITLAEMVIKHKNSGIHRLIMKLLTYLARIRFWRLNLPFRSRR